MTKLKQTYGLPLTSNTHGALLIRLTENKIQSSESISDYIARVERLISDLRQQEQQDMSARMKKHYILYGLRDDDRWKHIATTARQNDIHGQWSFDDLKQYLINEEYNAVPPPSSLPLSQQSSLSSSPGVTTTATQAHTASSHSRFRRNKHKHGGSNNQLHRSHHHNNLHERPFKRKDRSASPIPDPHIQCFTCGGIGHRSSICPSNTQQKKKCELCGKRGHTIDTCFHNKKRKRDDQDDAATNNRPMRHSSY